MPVTEIVCRSCGKCCWLLVVLDDEDMVRIKNADLAHLIERHYGVFEGSVSGELLKDPWVLKRMEKGRCIALDPLTHCCTVYEHRPNICRDVEPCGEMCRDILTGHYVCFFKEKNETQAGT